MKYLFVGGSQRSGTTMLQKLLCLDPVTTPRLAEASYFRALVQAYQLGLNDFEHDTQSYFDTPLAFRHFHSGLCYQFLNRTLASHPQASTLVLKEPHLTPLFPRVHELIPDARFVVIVRDPLDIIASMIGVGERMAEQGDQHFFQQRDIPALANHIKSFYAPVINHKQPAFQDRVMTVRYEDLASHPENLRDRLSRFTGLPLATDLRQPLNPEGVSDAGEAQKRYHPWLTELNDGAVSTQSVGRYRQVLSEEEQTQAREACADFNTLFGYQT
ncbi:MAG: sulfotransferase family protein [Pseudomonadota bacterium]